MTRVRRAAGPEISAVVECVSREIKNLVQKIIRNQLPEDPAGGKGRTTTRALGTTHPRNAVQP